MSHPRSIPDACDSDSYWALPPRRGTRAEAQPTREFPRKATHVGSAEHRESYGHPQQHLPPIVLNSGRAASGIYFCRRSLALPTRTLVPRSRPSRPRSLALLRAAFALVGVILVSQEEAEGAEEGKAPRELQEGVCGGQDRFKRVPLWHNGPADLAGRRRAANRRYSQTCPYGNFSKLFDLRRTRLVFIQIT